MQSAYESPRYPRHSPPEYRSPDSAEHQRSGRPFDPPLEDEQYSPPPRASRSARPPRTPRTPSAARSRRRHSRPPSPSPSPSIQRKRLIVACDGTWLDSDNSLKHNRLELPSNVTRICRAIKTESTDEIAQIVYYQHGVGTQGSSLERLLGGALGEGLSANIREAYLFICHNYAPGDEIFLLGFSRGAFTARSIAGLVCAMGLLTKGGITSLPVIFKDFENRGNPDYESEFPNIPYQNKPSASNPSYQIELEKLRLTRLHITIKAVAIWETVGSLGIPRITWLERLGLQRQAMKEYRFYDTSLSNGIENAFQALALDEQRSTFSPSVWEKTRSNRTNLRQVWFPGVHRNVGGGYEDSELSNITLAWMIAQLEPFIDFNPDYIKQQFRENRSYYDQSNQNVRPWSFGEIYASLRGIYLLDGRQTRTPGLYHRLNPRTGAATSKPLRHTNEYIHPSVRTRIVLKGPGPSDNGTYECPAMSEYKLRFTGAEPGGKKPVALWESQEKRKGVPRRVLPESPLWGVELRLLGWSREVEEYYFERRKER